MIFCQYVLFHIIKNPENKPIAFKLLKTVYCFDMTLVLVKQKKVIVNVKNRILKDVLLFKFKVFNLNCFCCIYRK